MSRTHVAIIFCIFSIIVTFYGCATVGGGDALDSYKELKSAAFGFEGRSKMADTAPVLTEESTLSDYLAYAALYNPELEAAFNRWKAALEKIPQVRSLPDPRFTYAYYIENVETKVGPQYQKIDIAQTFPWFGKLRLLGDVALEESNIQRQKYESSKIKLFYQVKEIYFEYYYLSRELSITEENMKLLSYFETVARTKYTAGKAAYADVIKAQVELGILEERLLSLRDLREPVVARLNAALNRPPDAHLPWPESVPDESILLSDEEIINQINDYNPELKALDFKAAKETKSVYFAKKQFYPDITLGMSYIATDTSSMPGTVDSGKDPIMTMLSINLPIQRNKYRAAVREHEIRHKSALKERENRQNVIVSDVKTALYNFRDSGRKIDLYKNSLIPKALQSLNVTQTAFEAGKKDFLSLIDTQRILLELELAYERALANRAKFRALVVKIMGRDF